MSDFTARPIPKPVLLAVAAFVGLTLLLTSAVALGLLERPKPAVVERAEAGVARVAARSLVFADRADGALVVRDPAVAEPVAVIEPNSNQGFVRGVMRSMARERRLRGASQVAPYELALWADGRLTLLDPLTGRTVELDSFGATNRAAFRAFLAEAPR
ncbi:photosynthetic complex assembly protein PuhC [Thermaurantiacus sp.]